MLCFYFAASLGTGFLLNANSKVLVQLDGAQHVGRNFLPANRVAKSH